MRRTGDTATFSSTQDPPTGEDDFDWHRLRVVYGGSNELEKAVGTRAIKVVPPAIGSLRA